MRAYEDQDFQSVKDRDSGGVFENLEFRRCRFRGSILSLAKKPDFRSTCRNVQVIDCVQTGCTIYAAVLENVLIDGLKCTQLLQCWGAVFKHVVLRGNIDRLMISSKIGPMRRNSDAQVAFNSANAAFYSGVDWAVDISKGEFKELSVSGIPAGLIRRDPGTQLIVTRDRARAVDWRSLPFRERLWMAFLERFDKTQAQDIVLAAPKRHPKFKAYLTDLELLERAGVAQR